MMSLFDGRVKRCYIRGVKLLYPAIKAGRKYINYITKMYNPDNDDSK